MQEEGSVVGGRIPSLHVFPNEELDELLVDKQNDIFLERTKVTKA